MWLSTQTMFGGHREPSDFELQKLHSRNCPNTVEPQWLEHRWKFTLMHLRI